ncbi:hypothetical protein [Ralstonia sp. ASV6]|uniref:hypothetical protein n=1 Tax=Ralstonia sp. ASV6 TaxID=2795124 RepID=UPI0018ED8556|nr:hypothetical protein [Ralstonia sp. ASV6]
MTDVDSNLSVVEEFFEVYDSSFGSSLFDTQAYAGALATYFAREHGQRHLDTLANEVGLHNLKFVKGESSLRLTRSQVEEIGRVLTRAEMQSKHPGLPSDEIDDMVDAAVAMGFHIAYLDTLLEALRRRGISLERSDHESDAVDLRPHALSVERYVFWAQYSAGARGAIRKLIEHGVWLGRGVAAMSIPSALRDDVETAYKHARGGHYGPRWTPELGQYFQKELRRKESFDVLWKSLSRLGYEPYRTEQGAVDRREWEARKRSASKLAARLGVVLREASLKSRFSEYMTAMSRIAELIGLQFVREKKPLLSSQIPEQLRSALEIALCFDDVANDRKLSKAPFAEQWSAAMALYDRGHATVRLGDMIAALMHCGIRLSPLDNTSHPAKLPLMQLEVAEVRGALAAVFALRHHLGGVINF